MFSSASPTDPRSLLSTRRAAGEYVLRSARMVGDEEDYAIWQRGCETWRAAVARTLEAHSFDTPTTLPQRQPPAAREGWKREYEADLRDVAATLQALAKLAEELHSEAAHVAVGAELAFAG